MTMIELLVSLLLLAIVLVLLFSVVLDLFRGSERSRQRSKAQRNITLVSEKLTSDIHAMRAPNRNPKDTSGLEMMREGWFAPTLNLRQVDPACAKLDYIMGEGRALTTDLVMSNNFAFGGINTSLIFRRWPE